MSYAYGTSLRSWNLACRGYNPTSDQVAGDWALDLLVDWMKMILKEFQIEAEDDVLTSCTDSGSDVNEL